MGTQDLPDMEKNQEPVNWKEVSETLETMETIANALEALSKVGKTVYLGEDDYLESNGTRLALEIMEMASIGIWKCKEELEDLLSPLFKQRAEAMLSGMKVLWTKS